jgi:hypothetical protein
VYLNTTNNVVFCAVDHEDGWTVLSIKQLNLLPLPAVTKTTEFNRLVKAGAYSKMAKTGFAVIENNALTWGTEETDGQVNPSVFTQKEAELECIEIIEWQLQQYHAGERQFDEIDIMTDGSNEKECIAILEEQIRQYNAGERMFRDIDIECGDIAIYTEFENGTFIVQDESGTLITSSIEEWRANH